MRTARKVGLTVAAVLAVLFGLVVPSGAAAASPSILVSRVVTSAKVMALTFDFGSDNANVSRILAALAGHGVRSTFFVTGEAAVTYPTDVRSLIAAGHEIGNHSYSHRSFTELTTTQMADELARAATAIRETTGQPPRPYFRPPNGDYNATVLQVVGNAGYGHTIMWTIDTLDWQGWSSTTIRDRVISRAVPGAIVLMHVGAGASGTPGALPDMITSLKAAGYQFVTISQLLGAPWAPPSAPPSLVASVPPTSGVGSGQVSLQWGLPAANGSPITDYIIWRSSDGGATWRLFVDGVSTSRSYLASGLTNGHRYIFRVAARNAVGVGPFSYVAASPRWHPGAPPGIAAAVAPSPGVGSGQVLLTWGLPSTRGAAITDYIIWRSSDGGATWRLCVDGVSATRTYLASGLTNGHPYRFRVAGRNAVGVGPFSYVSATPLALPGLVVATSSTSTTSTVPPASTTSPATTTTSGPTTTSTTVPATTVAPTTVPPSTVPPTTTSTSTSTTTSAPASTTTS